MNDTVYLNGEFLARDAARISPFDRGFLYGDGLFETVRAYASRPFRLDAHLDRLAASAAALAIPMPDRGHLVGIVNELIRRNDLADAVVRVALSRGRHGGRLWPTEPTKPTVLVEARPFRSYPVELYERGADVIVSSIAHDAASGVRRHKTANYLPSILAKREAIERETDEAILLAPDGDVAEGATCNLFCVRYGRLMTPPLDLGILPGVTRATVLELARAADLNIAEKRFGLPALATADEVFLTNSLMELLPVRRVILCDGRSCIEAEDNTLAPCPGPLTRRLTEAYRAFIAQP
jgi:branched-chain amino acid aminotransferase